jgi:hypothetical protein
MDYVAIAVIAVFAGLSLVHFYWAFGGTAGKDAAVPERAGRRLFTPSAGATVMVAVGLALCGLLVAATAGPVSVPPTGRRPRWPSYLLALVLLARAIGDFRRVGFFQRVRGTRFARLDSRVYAPLCLLLAAGDCDVAARDGA